MGMLLHRHARRSKGETPNTEPQVTEKVAPTPTKKRSKKPEEGK